MEDSTGPIGEPCLEGRAVNTNRAAEPHGWYLAPSDKVVSEIAGNPQDLRDLNDGEKFRGAGRGGFIGFDAGAF